MVVHYGPTFSRPSLMQVVPRDGSVATGGSGKSPATPNSSAFHGSPPHSGKSNNSALSRTRSTSTSALQRLKLAFGDSPSSDKESETFFDLIASYPKTDTFELNGNLKINMSTSNRITIPNLTSPDCIFKNLSQITKYNTGKPWFRSPKIPPNFGNRENLLYWRLHNELEDFYRLMKPIKEDDTLRRATFYGISNVIRQMPNLHIDTVKYYGSFSSHTYLPVSDIDLVVYTDHNVSQSNLLRQIALKLFEAGIIHMNCSIIPNSRIPLLKFYDSLTGFPINITINTPKVLERSKFIRNEIKTNSYLIKILYFLKYYLLHKGLNQVFLGGIGSYSLSMLVIRYFQEDETRAMIEDQPCRDSILGRLFLGFLDRFTKLDFISNHIITVRDGGAYIPCSGQVSPGKRQSVLLIQDHLEPWKYISSGSYNSQEILKYLRDFYSMIKKTSLQKLRDPDHSLLNQAVTVIDDLVDYRILLCKICHDWVPDDNSEHKIADFVQRRNFYGPRKLEFHYRQNGSETSEEISAIKIEPINRRLRTTSEWYNSYDNEDVDEMAYNNVIQCQQYFRRDTNPADRRANLMSMNASVRRFNTMPQYTLHFDHNFQQNRALQSAQYRFPKRVSHYGDFQLNSQQYNRKPRRNGFEPNHTSGYRVPDKANLNQVSRSNCTNMTGNPRIHFDPNSGHKNYLQNNYARFRTRHRAQATCDHPPDEANKNTSPQARGEPLRYPSRSASDTPFNSLTKSPEGGATKAIKQMLNINSNSNE